MKVGFISIIGKANAGKSTLINNIIGTKVSIVSHHPQTTRNEIKGIYTKDNTQIVFVDTPGIHKGKNILSNYMNKTINSAIVDVNAIIYVIAADKGLSLEDKKLIEKYSEKNKNLIIVLSKCDIVKKEKIVALINEISSFFNSDKIVPISSVKNKNIDELLKVVNEFLVEGDAYYPEEYYTDKTERFLISEIIREKIIHRLEKELPFGIAVFVDKIEEEPTITKIYASIICERQSHKKIIIGKAGNVIKEITHNSCYEIEKLLDKKVYIDLYVKAKEKWRDSNHFTKEFGYDLRDFKNE